MKPHHPILTLLLASAACLLHPAPAESRDLFVSTTGDDSTGESWETSLNSIGRALGDAEEGDAVHVAAGVYIESVTIPVGVSLLGGHPPQSSGNKVYNRNPRIYTTTIGATEELSAIRIRHDSILDGFTVFGRVFQQFEGRPGSRNRITIRTCNIYYEHSDVNTPAILAGGNDLRMEECFVRYSTDHPINFSRIGGEARIVNTIFSYDLPFDIPAILLAGSGPYYFVNCVIYDRGGDRNRPGGSFGRVGRVDSFHVLNTISNQGMFVSVPSPFSVPITSSIYPFASNIFAVHNNRDVDPQFVDPENDDFRVHPTSPAIDMGREIPGLLRPVRHDFLGRPRVVDIPGIGGTLAVPSQTDPPGYAIDIGAYEMQLDEYGLRSDLNGDGGVDALDLFIFGQDWKQPTGP